MDLNLSPVMTEQMKKYWKSIEEKNQKVISKSGEEKDMSRNTIIETMTEGIKFDNNKLFRASGKTIHFTHTKTK